jgi:serine protease
LVVQRNTDNDTEENAMNARNRNLSLIALTAALASGEVVAAAEIRRAANPIEDRYIVVLRRDGADEDAVQRGERVRQIAQSLAGSHRGGVGRQFASALDGFVFQGRDADAAALASNPAVAFVEEDGLVMAADSEVAASWGLDRIDQRPAALDQVYNFNTDGNGIDLYVIDTGIRSTHVEFGNRVDTARAWTAIADGRGTEDCNGHGTHVAGIAGGATYGVAKGVTLHPVRALDCLGSGQISDLIAGIDWITAQYPPPPHNRPAPPTRAVANLSLAANWSYAIDAAVEASVSAGITYVVAAGNGGTDACNFSPARSASAIRVAASDGAERRASYSNYGRCVDLFAPGSAIVSAYARHDADFVTMYGTSMATPHVAGTAALMLSLNPDARPQDVKSTILQASTSDQLTDVGELTPNRLLYSAFVGSGEDFPPVADFTFYCSNRNCNFDGKLSADDWGIVSYAWNFGDGTRPGKGAAVNHKYKVNAGNVVFVTLTVTDSTGQTTSIQQEVRLAW